jgi:pyruvate/2-oxoglutarate/acetoin dehydrogenase E1 component
MHDKTSMPVVLTSGILGLKPGFSDSHSLDAIDLTDACFAHVCGGRIVVPSRSDDASGMMRSAPCDRGAVANLYPAGLRELTYGMQDEQHDVLINKAVVPMEGVAFALGGCRGALTGRMKAAKAQHVQGMNVEVVHFRPRLCENAGELFKS